MNDVSGKGLACLVFYTQLVQVPVTVVPPVVTVPKESKEVQSPHDPANFKIVDFSYDDKSNESDVEKKGYLRKIVDSVLEKFSPDSKK